MATTDQINNNNQIKAKKVDNNLVKIYLVAYNLVQTLGWSYLVYQILDFYFAPTASKTSLYESVKWTLFVFQNGAALEIVHAFLKIVSSSPFLTLQQVTSRVVVVCLVLLPTIAPRNSIGLPLALFAWSVTEIIRYANYTLNLLNSIPYFLTWLRYSTFIVLYPIGVTGELLCLYAAQKEAGETNLLKIELPNFANFVFHYDHLLILTMLLYIPLFPPLYMHMFAQRKKALSRHAAPVTKKVK